MLYDTRMSGALLKQENFQPFVGRQITIRDRGTALGELRLDQVEELPGDHRREADGTACQPFSLLFTADPSFRLGQGNYEFLVGEDNAHVIFIVPVGPDRSGRMSYQAIFN
ncbi:MAG TPA: hypothetical protein VLE43_11005 [Candidatus Saccharimonadia bacterium]|nr:hypothetical protein [Candidatus Saccharimonadia bacterium]